jgi:hypothetical protein
MKFEMQPFLFSRWVGIADMTETERIAEELGFEPC